MHRHPVDADVLNLQTIRFFFNIYIFSNLFNFFYLGGKRGRDRTSKKEKQKIIPMPGAEVSIGFYSQ